MSKKAMPAGRRGFSQVILLGVITVLILVGTGGFLVFQKFQEKKIPSFEKTAQQPVPSQPRMKPKPIIPPTPNQTPKYIIQTPQTRDPWRDPLPPAPANIVLPFALKDMRKTDGLISPYGLIRHSRDTGVGHGGIDFPLELNSSIYAVADGTIVKNEKEDDGGGNTVDVLILPEKFLKEGWIFKYEHVALEPGLTIESKVQKGQKIGTNALQHGENNHIGLEYHIKNFTIARTKICWVDLLEPIARQQLEYEFNQIKKTQVFLESWQTANEEGYYQYKGLLDKTKYPDGPQLCYRIGTDARIPVN